MADSDNPRSRRAYDPHQRARADDSQHSGDRDPLAELARLIGQNDPFAEFERNRAGGDAQRTGHAPPQDWPAEPAQSRPPPYSGGYATDPNYPQAPPAPEPQAYPQYPPDAHAAYSEPGYGHQADTDPHGPQLYYDPYYDAEGNALDETDYYDQQDRMRRRRRLVVVAAVLLLAVVGGAGAYGYRTLLGPSVAPGPPPVIKADTTPMKVVPTVQAGDSASNKLIYDRVGESNRAEKVVPREEKPVDIKTATVTPQARVVYPTPGAQVVSAPSATIPVTGQATGGQVLPVASASSIAMPGSGVILPTPKKVRTVTIRPDMTVVPSSVSTQPSDPEPAAPTAPPTRSAEAPQPARSGAAEPSPAPVRPAPPPRQAVSAPLSLSPDAAPAAAPAQRASRPASEPMALAAAPSSPGAASEPRAVLDGSYIVQVSSQRSEAEAQASYRTLQARYPNVLAGHSSFVRRADLGSRGIYYRAMVGPFATAEQAGQFCSSLKAAGGQCIIHRN